MNYSDIIKANKSVNMDETEQHVLDFAEKCQNHYSICELHFIGGKNLFDLSSELLNHRFYAHGFDRIAKSYAKKHYEIDVDFEQITDIEKSLSKKYDVYFTCMDKSLLDLEEIKELCKKNKIKLFVVLSKEGNTYIERKPKSDSD